MTGYALRTLRRSWISSALSLIPAHPRRLLAAYDGGDHAHLSAAGYERMAAEVELADFQGRVCK